MTTPTTGRWRDLRLTSDEWVCLDRLLFAATGGVREADRLDLLFRSRGWPTAFDRLRALVGE